MADMSDERENKSAPADRQTAGPFDLSEITEVSPLIDLGSLRVKPNQQLRLEVTGQTKQLVAISIEIAESVLQVQAFAAPRSTGLWHEIRQNIADQVSTQGGTSHVEESMIGPQLIAQVPVKKPDGNVVRQDIRYIGVDGPRWFLRGVVTGKAVTDPASWAEVEEAFRAIVVVRGTKPMPPRDLLPLKLPGAQINTDFQQDAGV